MRWQGAGQSDNVEDRRRMGGPAVAMGGGGMLLLMLIAMFFGIDPRQVQQQVNKIPQGQQEERELTPEEEQEKAFIATVLRFTEVVWGEQFQKAGKVYEKPQVVLFTDGVETGCGNAPSAVGPFYCPNDRTVYIDPTFFDQLEGELGGSKAEFSQAYVLAHEIGHHVQTLLGYSQRAHSQQGALGQGEGHEMSVRLELQADYLAGVWAHYGQEKFNFIEPGDVESALTSANAIGDDRLQKRSTGFTSPEKYTHGTSAQRVKWFRRGLETGDLGQIDDLFNLPYDQL